MESGPDEALIAAARQGDMRALSTLIDQAQGPVRAFLRRLTGSQADADDLAQDAFAMAITRLDRIRTGSRFRAFVCGVAFQLWRQGRRADGRRQRRERAYSDLHDQEVQAPANAASRVALRRAMEDLRPEQRAALALCIGAEFTQEEASVALNLPLGTVKSHISRGLARLRAAFGEGSAT